MSAQLSYKTLRAENSAEFVINKSRFIGYGCPCETEEEALAFLARIRQKHKDATHNCYAYIIGLNSGIMRYSDDGEPGGTAGMPIIEVMKARGVVNCAVVVTRYFGGILLGAGGLVRAYAQGSKAALDAAGVRGYRKHACDSIGMVRYPERHMGAVRTGAWLYGVCPYHYEHPERCRPVVTLKARVAQLRTLPAGECVGYDDSHPLSHDARIATLSAGYVDGFPRFNGKGEVCIHGRRAPVLGLVCMDQMMVDVTDIPEVREDDEAILWGGTVSDTAETIARKTDTIPYEVLCGVSRRVPRVYRDHGQIVAVEDWILEA